MLSAGVLRVTLGGSANAPPVVDSLVARRLAQVAAWFHRLQPASRLVVENHWGIASEPARLMAIVAEAHRRLPAAARPALGVCFDPGNMAEAARPEGWPILAAAAKHFHLKAVAFDEAGAESSLPYDHLFALLRRAGYRGYVVVEYAGDGPPEAGISQGAALFHRLYSLPAA
jgi:sugar phosphate isomerase/epimerase